jgi:hypothetical protein
MSSAGPFKSAAVGWALALSFSGEAAACSCGPGAGSIISRASVAFVGSVISVRSGGPLGRVATLRVVRPIKNIRRGTVVRVATQATSAACGWNFRAGARRVTVAASRIKGNMLKTDKCKMYPLNPL